MKRQNIRKLILILSLLLFPIIIWYMSPYLIMQGASEGIMTGSFIVFAAMLITSPFLGRLFCGWICPMGGLQECLFAVNDKAPKQGWRNRIKYVIWTVWITAVTCCFVFRKGTIRVDFFYMTDHGISVSQIGNYIIYYGVITLVLIPAVLFGKRIFCHYFCWMAPFMILGVKITRFLHLPRLQIVAKQEECVSCHLCEKNCPMAVPVTEMIQEGKDFGAECIQCGSCIDHCPKGALSYGLKVNAPGSPNR